MVVGLVLIALALVTIYLREAEGGPLHAIQRGGSAALHPFQIAGERIARPFRDAYTYVSDLVDARSEAEALRKQVEELQRGRIESQGAAEEVARLRRLLDYKGSEDFPNGYEGVTARVIQVPSSPFEQEIVVAAGSGDGVQVDAPVITPDGLVGKVVKVGPDLSRVALLTDQQMGVTAQVLETQSRGIVRAAPSSGSGLVLDRVAKEEIVSAGDTVVTAGWREGELASLYPFGIVIGTITGVGLQDIDLYYRITIRPAVDFGSLTDVIVLKRREVG